MRPIPILALASLALWLVASCSAVAIRSEPSLAKSSPDSPTFEPRLEVLEATIEASDAHLVVCYDIPSDEDWVLGRLPGDVRLSDGPQTASMRSFTSFSIQPASAGTPARRCDNLIFPLPDGFGSCEDTLTIERIAASLPANPDWTELRRRLGVIAPGIVIEPLQDAGGLSFALIDKPPGMTDIQAHDIVVGIAEPVQIGPWEIPIEFGGS